MDPARVAYIEKIYAIWGGILLIWALYRHFFMLPETVDEFIVKPIVFLGPVLFFVLYKEKRPLSSIGIHANKFVRDLYLAMGFGLLFTVIGIVTNFFKYGSINLNPIVPITGATLLVTLILSLATAFTEEVLIRGFFYTRLAEGYQSQFKALLSSVLMYLLILVPIIFTRLSLNPQGLMLIIVSNIILSSANTMIFTETKSLIVPILIHAFWNMAVVLYL